MITILIKSISPMQMASHPFSRGASHLKCRSSCIFQGARGSQLLSLGWAVVPTWSSPRCLLPVRSGGSSSMPCALSLRGEVRLYLPPLQFAIIDALGPRMHTTSPHLPFPSSNLLPVLPGSHLTCCSRHCLNHLAKMLIYHIPCPLGKPPICPC